MATLSDENPQGRPDRRRRGLARKLEPVRQRDPGACGTVDGCHGRESQTHPWKAPPGGPHRPAGQGARQPQLRTAPRARGLHKPASMEAAARAVQSGCCREPRDASSLTSVRNPNTAETDRLGEVVPPAGHRASLVGQSSRSEACGDLAQPRSPPTSARRDSRRLCCRSIGGRR